jgi:hypothetical protein
LLVSPLPPFSPISPFSWLVVEDDGDGDMNGDCEDGGDDDDDGDDNDDDGVMLAADVLLLSGDGGEDEALSVGMG